MNEAPDTNSFQLPRISEGAYITMVGILLPFASFIKAIMYYDTFGIPIAGFLDFSEILTLFVNDILLYFFIFSCIVLIEYISWHYKSVNAIADQFLNILFIILIILLACYFIQALDIPWLQKLFSMKSITGIFTGTTTGARFSKFIMGILILFYLIAGFVSAADQPGKQLFKIGAKLMCLLALILHHGRYDSYNVYASKKILPVASIVKTNNSTIKMSTDTIYIGKTKEYYFLFSKIQQQALLLRTEEIASVTMKAVPDPTIVYLTSDTLQKK